MPHLITSGLLKLIGYCINIHHLGLSLIKETLLVEKENTI